LLGNLTWALKKLVIKATKVTSTWENPSIRKKLELPSVRKYSAHHCPLTGNRGYFDLTFVQCDDALAQ
jgi:hypothetical protein